jgi:hypothetical protein
MHDPDHKWKGEVYNDQYTKQLLRRIEEIFALRQ